jgi:hypothetical protein
LSLRGTIIGKKVKVDFLSGLKCPLDILWTEAPLRYPVFLTAENPQKC